MKTLIEEMVKLIEFHELAEVDSKAAELLEQAKNLKHDDPVDTEFADHIEQIRQENISPLLP